MASDRAVITIWDVVISLSAEKLKEFMLFFEPEDTYES